MGTAIDDPPGRDGHDRHDGRAVPRGAADERRLALALAPAATYMGAEVVGGIAARSLALLADAGHMLSDAASLALALFAVRMARRPATARRTYGHYRAEILAALANGAALVAVSVWIVVEAIGRFRHPVEVRGGLMAAVAAGGLAVNLAGLWVLRGDRSDGLNVRGARLHVLSDAAGSLQALVAGGLLLAFGWTWVDPAASLAIAGLVAASSWSLLRETVGVLMEGAPAHLDVDKVRAAMLDVPGVEEVFDLHVWTITSGLVALSAHVRAGAGPTHACVLRDLRTRLADRFRIAHVTIQLEEEDACEGDHGPV